MPESDSLIAPPNAPPVPRDWSHLIDPAVTQRLLHTLGTLFIPPERLSLSTWAERNMVLSSEYSARTGLLHLYGWQRGILDAFTDPEVEEMVLMTGVQLVKCLDLSTLLPTPDGLGWLSMRSVSVGDRLFDESGEICSVTAVSRIFHGRKCYRLTFDDASSIVSDSGHYWAVFDGLNEYCLATTEQMFEAQHSFRKNGVGNRFRIQCCQALNTAEAELPIEPYVLGCWLGDGWSSGGYISADVRDGVINEIKKTGTECDIVAPDPARPHLVRVHIGPKIGSGCTRAETIAGRLRELEVLNNKRIPDIYLRASIEQRRSLLQGLLDTDGTVINNGSGVVISQVNLRLGKDISELAVSLGYKATYKIKRASLYGRDCGDVAVIYLTAYAEDRPFRLPRKANKMRSVEDMRSRRGESRKRSVVSIEEVPSVPVRCLTVNSPSRLFLAGRGMIPTHNSLAIQCAIAYVICCDPGPILLLQPKEDSAMAFSKRRLGPMARDMECLKGKMSESIHVGETKNTLLSKTFPGGNLLIISANTPTDVAQHTIRYVFCDEPDKYPLSAGREGDPMDLAWERATTFGSRRKRILACSPTVAGLSRIGKAYDSSDRRRPWVPCPRCGTHQILKWEQVKNMDGGSFVINSGRDARYECVVSTCRHGWTDVERWAACEEAVWQADAPFAGIAGFWISHLYSPWKRLPQIAKHWLGVYKDRTRRQVFINTVLAEQYQDAGETPDAERLYARRASPDWLMVPHPDGTTGPVIPQRGLFLTAAVDVQDNPPRLECGVTAWGRDRECWSIGHYVIQAHVQVPSMSADGVVSYSDGALLPVTDRALWDRLDREILQRSWLHESGHYLSIWLMTIDTGKRPQPVYEFAKRHAQLAHGPAGIKLHAVRTVVPVKGTPDNLRIISGVSKEDQARKRQGVRIVGVGTHCVKQEIYDILQHVSRVEDGTLSGSVLPGCYHFPLYTISYFHSLTAEARVVKDNGDVVWEKRAERNEVFDIAVYQRAAAEIAGIKRFTEAQWKRMEDQVRPIPAEYRVQTVPVSLPLDRVSVPASDVGSRPLTRANAPLPQQSVLATALAPAPPVSAPHATRPIRPIRGGFGRPR